MPLKDQCMNVIMSSLLQQRLELDQLHATLPDYVSTTLQNSIMHSFKARTLQLVPFSPASPGSSPSPMPSDEDDEDSEDEASPTSPHSDTDLSPQAKKPRQTTPESL